MNSQDNNATAVIARSHLAVMISFYALLGTFSVQTLWRLIEEDNATAIVFLWVIKMAPLLIFIPGLHRRHLRTHAWLSFVVLLYFVQGVQTAFIAESRIYGTVVTLLLSLLFCALIMYIRRFRNYYKTSL